VLHNPASDRRTTAGVFHIVEGGLPIPDDKLAVPKLAFSRCWRWRSIRRPNRCSCLSRPTSRRRRVFRLAAAAPAGRAGRARLHSEKRMETRFFVPGSLVANLDFVESFSATAAIPTCRKTTPRSTRMAGPGTPAA
jgi:hypothetical protein